MKCQASQFWVENLVCSIFIFPSSSYLPTVRDGLAGWGPNVATEKKFETSTSLGRPWLFSNCGGPTELQKIPCQLLCYCTGLGLGGVQGALEEYHDFSMASINLTSSNQGFCHQLRTGADSCQIWRHDVFMSQLCIVLPLVFKVAETKKRPWHMKNPTNNLTSLSRKYPKSPGSKGWMCWVEY